MSAEARRRWAALVLLLPSPAALAHVSALPHDGLLAGLLHYLGAPQWPLGAAVLGLLAAQRGRDAVAWSVLALPAALAAGALLSGVVAAWPPAGAAAVGMTLLLGMLVALAVPLPAVAAPLLALPVGVLQGIGVQAAAHGDGGPIMAALGIALGGQLVVTTVAMLASAGVAWRWQSVAVRALGSWIAAIGLLTLAARLAGYG